MLALEARDTAELLSDRSLDVFTVEQHVTRNPKTRNETSDNLRNIGSQAEIFGSTSGERMLIALGPRDRKWLTRATGISASTISDYAKRGISNAAAAVAIADVLGVTLDWLLTGRDPPSASPPISIPWARQPTAPPRSPGTLDVPVFDIEVSAGPGRSPLDETPIGHWPMPIQWLAERSSGNPDFMIVKVNGDSQEPELKTGDQLIVDRGQRQLRTGMHVIRLDEDLLVKRVQMEGRKVRLLSANPAYPATTLDREADGDRFEVIGRAVGAIKAL